MAIDTGLPGDAVEIQVEDLLAYGVELCPHAARPALFCSMSNSTMSSGCRSGFDLAGSTESVSVSPLPHSTQGTMLAANRLAAFFAEISAFYGLD